MILAGSRVGDIVLDPFFGSGTTGQVSQALGRKWIGCELNKNYETLQNQRVSQQGLELI
jgi:DNA modification methylase